MLMAVDAYLVEWIVHYCFTLNRCSNLRWCFHYLHCDSNTTTSCVTSHSCFTFEQLVPQDSTMVSRWAGCGAGQTWYCIAHGLCQMRTCPLSQRAASTWWGVWNEERRRRSRCTELPVTQALIGIPSITGRQGCHYGCDGITVLPWRSWRHGQFGKYYGLLKTVTDSTVLLHLWRFGATNLSTQVKSSRIGSQSYLSDKDRQVTRMNLTSCHRNLQVKYSLFKELDYVYWPVRPYWDIQILHRSLFIDLAW